MSESLDEIIVAPNPKNLDQFAVWRNPETRDSLNFDPDARGPFNFKLPPIAVFDTSHEAMVFARKEAAGKSDIRLVHKTIKRRLSDIVEWRF